jgi:hypothetical protein
MQLEVKVTIEDVVIKNHLHNLQQIAKVIHEELKLTGAEHMKINSAIIDIAKFFEDIVRVKDEVVRTRGKRDAEGTLSNNGQ